MSLPEIAALTRVLARSDARNARQQARNLERLDELCAYLDGHADPGSAACLSACCALIAMLAKGRAPDEGDVLDAVCKLMATVEEHWSGTDPDVELASTIYAEGSAAAESDQERTIASDVQSAKSTVFPAGDIEDAQRRIETLKGTPRINEMVLGELLIELGHLTDDDVQAAVEQQGQTGELLGEVLVRSGVLDAAVLEETIRLQTRLRAESTLQALAEPPAPTSGKRRPPLRLGAAEALKQRQRNDDYTLGAILLRQGAITEADLESALDVQRASGLRLGETLVERHASCWETVNRAIELQRRLRAAAGARVWF